MFRELAQLEDGSATFQRQRDRIVERCLNGGLSCDL